MPALQEQVQIPGMSCSELAYDNDPNAEPPPPPPQWASTWSLLDPEASPLNSTLVLLALLARAACVPQFQLRWAELALF